MKQGKKQRRSALDTLGDAVLAHPAPHPKTEESVLGIRPAIGSDTELRFRFARHLTMISRRWRTRLDERLRAIGQTQARWQTLFWIALSGKAPTQREIADRVGVEGPTLVRTINALEQLGLVERRAGGDDRRTKTLHLTGKAEPLLREISDIADDLRDDLLRDVTREELKICLSVFSRVLKRLDEA